MTTINATHSFSTTSTKSIEVWISMDDSNWSLSHYGIVDIGKKPNSGGSSGGGGQGGCLSITDSFNDFGNEMVLS